MRRLCTICARGGSTGVVNKNIRLLHGLPLIAHSIRQAQQSGLFDHIAVSSDSSDILAAAKAYGVRYLVERPAPMATNEAPKLPAIRHCALEAERMTGIEFDTVVDLDATAPLRTSGDIAGAVALLEQSGAPNVITGTPSRRSPYFNMVELTARGTAVLAKPPSSPIARRQDAPATYDLNAAVYVWQRDWLVTCTELFNERTRLFVMAEDRATDIDTEADFAYVDYLLARKKEHL
ncbi:cytidylyltransferase domain-containing protein [Paenibacillus hodogayensis]|uniref:Cytidylyltransferase domain-containing protein n=1 Tax=Paenibacillus hodogayensis TaxID=279208 RepID=A0ABV5VYP5_9BACL